MLGFTFIRQCARYLHTSSLNLGSALYITGQKASETYAVLTPHVNGDIKLNNITSLQENISARGLDIDVDKLKKSWDFLKTVKESKYQLESRREETSNKIKSLVQNKSEKTESEIKGLKILGKMLRDNLKVINKEVWELEESVMLRILSLPNELHPDTPKHEEIVIQDNTKPPQKSSLSHIEIGHKSNVLKFISPVNYYLQNTTAEFELSVLQHTSDYLNKNNFIETSNCDFSKSIIVEGCGLKHTDSNEVFIIQTSDNNEDAKLHLVGGASLPAFCALFTKQETMLEEPIKLFSLGRHYSPPVHTQLPGLFNIAQESSIELFITTVNCENQLIIAFNQALQLIQDLYNSLDLNIKIVKCSAQQLKNWESHKISLQMYSQNLEKYIEVGHISLCGKYISERLLMKYKGSEGEKDFLNVISGRVMSVPKVLACILEEEKFEHVNSKVSNVLY